MILGVPEAPESWRRVAGLHRELCHRSANKTYYLSCRDAAKAWHGLSKSEAANINRALDRLAVIKIVRIGDARPNGKASKFRYLLPHPQTSMADCHGVTLAKAGRAESAGYRHCVVSAKK